MSAVYAFSAEWFDELADATKPFLIHYYEGENGGEVSISDLKLHRVFLRRTAVPGLALDDLRPGRNVVILGRQYHVTGYGNNATQQALEAQRESTCALIKPAAFPHIGVVIDAIETAGLTVDAIRTVMFTDAFLQQFYAEHTAKPFFPALAAAMKEGPVTMMRLAGPGAIAAWRALMGPTDPAAARAQAPDSLRARLGTDVTRNAVHGSDSPAAAQRELALCFGQAGAALASSAVLQGTLCVVKPHIVRAHQLGKVLALVAATWPLSAVESFELERADAEDFLEVYRGVYPQSGRLVDAFSSGAVVAVAVAGADADIVARFRAWCGPFDPQVARVLAPGSVRALFGADVVDNAVHTTDLPEDAQLELGFFFDLLQQK